MQVVLQDLQLWLEVGLHRGRDDHQVAIVRHFLLRGQQHGLGDVILTFERGAKTAIGLRAVHVAGVGLAVAFDQADRLLRRVRHLDDRVGDGLLVPFAHQRGLVPVTDADRSVVRDAVLLGEVRILVRVDYLNLHVGRLLGVALEELLDRGVAPRLDERHELEVLVELLHVLRGKRREAVDPGFGGVDALEVARREKVHHHEDAKKQHRVERRVGAEFRGALAEERAEALPRRRQVSDQGEDPEQHVGHHEEAHVLRDGEGDRAEEQRGEADDPEARLASPHR